MTTCIFCGNPITFENDSKEHVIPQSIGGRKKVSGFLCRNCNSKTGEMWDAKLASQYNWFAVMLNIKRESNTPPPVNRVQTANGHTYRLHPDGKIALDRPLVTAERTPNGRRISVTARTLDEARGILEGIQRKHPEVDIEKTLANANISTTYLNEPVRTTFEFCGELGGRSIVKTAMAMAFKMGINPQECDFALSYLKDSTATPAFAEFHLRDLVVNRPTTHLFNCVAVKGDTNKKRLTAYVEYFGITRVLVHLSQDYAGPNIHESYAFNPVTGLEIPLNIDLDLSNHEYSLSLENDARSDDAYEKAAAYAMPIILQFRQEMETTSVLNEAITEAFEAMGVQPGEELPTERIPAFTALIVNKIVPYLTRRMSDRRSG